MSTDRRSDDQYHIPRAKLQVDDNVELLFKEKARLQVPMKNAEGKVTSWESKGIGMLSVRKAKTEGAKPYIALFTESVSAACHHRYNTHALGIP